ncbi:MAG TPA: TatD family hydrolase [Bacillota bacterium]|nr:TatD family hydrolase [Bacillota bacterium]
MLVIDSHIHLDMYKARDQRRIVNELRDYQIEVLISVSNDYLSAVENLRLAQEHENVKVAIGFHPEQALPSDKELIRIISLIHENKHNIIGIGEVGLPYYLRKDNPQINNEPYIKLLETFVQLAAHLKLPIVLHAVYEDAPIACKLLEKYHIKRAHFHWFKGDEKTLDRIVANGHVISITPDVCYEEEIQQIVDQVPLKHMLVETDGPWAFDGPFASKLTHPQMIHPAIEKIAAIKQMDINHVYEQLYQNTKTFYNV